MMLPYLYPRFPYYTYPQKRIINRYNSPYNKQFVDNTNYNSHSQNINEEKVEDNENFFEILGIKLYYDDILIVCILYFLYSEGVKDEWLFISLILILLS